MKTTKETIIFNHLGFPIILIDWPHLEINGSWEPDIHYEALERLIFEMLPYKPSRLTGAEIKFIRTYLEMTQAQFAKWLRDIKDASTVAIWEKFDLKQTNIDSAMEKSLRMQLIVYISEKNRKKTIQTTVFSELSHYVIERRKTELKLDSKSFFPLPTKIETSKIYAAYAS